MENSIACSTSVRPPYSRMCELALLATKYRLAAIVAARSSSVPAGPIEPIMMADTAELRAWLTLRESDSLMKPGYLR